MKGKQITNKPMWQRMLFKCNLRKDFVAFLVVVPSSIITICLIYHQIGQPVCKRPLFKRNFEKPVGKICRRIFDDDPQRREFFYEKYYQQDVLPGLNCSYNGNFSIYQSGDILMVGNSSKKFHQNSIQCFYQGIYRNGDFQPKFGSIKMMKFPFSKWPNDTDFIRVSCFHRQKMAKKGKPIFRDSFSNVKNSRLNFSKNAQQHQRWNVVIIGIDSLSHGLAKYRIPKTINRLKMMEAIFLNNLNKVGVNTYPNTIALLSGQTLKPNESNFASDFQLIWSDYQRHGYATMYVEDSKPSISTFNFLQPGFKPDAAPTLHYGRPFFQALYGDDSSANGLSYCKEGRSNHEIIFKYLKQFVKNYENENHFSFSIINEISHDGHSHLGHIDENLLQVVDEIIGNSPNTFVLIWSDHGQRSGA